MYPGILVPVSCDLTASVYFFCDLKRTGWTTTQAAGCADGGYSGTTLSDCVGTYRLQSGPSWYIQRQ